MFAITIAALIAVQVPSQEPPNPFEDYRQAAPAVVPAPRSAAVATGTQLGHRIDQGTLTVGGSLLQSYTLSFNEVVGATSNPASTFFLKAMPHVGYFIIPKLELRVGLGLIARQLARSDGGTALEFDGLLEAGATYHWDLSPRFVVTAAAGVGPYLGSSTHELTVNAKSVSEQTTTFGLIGSVGVGAGYLIMDGLTLRGELIINGLVGGESLSSQDKVLFATTLNTGLQLGVSYVF